MDVDLSECRWPELESPYDRGLRQAVRFILQTFDVLGIIVSGTIIRGNPGPNSDFDIIAVHARQQRQRIQKFFSGVPTEIFLNPVSALEGYLSDEARRGRPSTAHMLLTGFTILDRDPAIASLRRQAEVALAQPPNPSESRLTWLRYGAADRFENAQDLIGHDTAGASLLLALAVFDMLQYAFWRANRYQPRDKAFFEGLTELDAELADLARTFYTVADMEQRLALAEAIADRTIKVRGFFPWSSPPEDV